MEIRAYTPNDNKEFVKFYEALVKENDTQLLTPKEMEEHIAKEEKKLENKHKYSHLFIAEEDNEIVGYLAIKHIHFERIRHIAKLSLGFLKEYQEKENLGAQLVQYAIQWAENNNIKRLEIVVADKDNHLEDLLEDLDFATEGTRKHSLKIKDKYHDEVIMVKEINKN